MFMRLEKTLKSIVVVVVKLERPTAKKTKV